MNGPNRIERGAARGPARRVSRLFEPIHDVVYFAPEARAMADRLGMRGSWMGYFALRGAPVGEVDPSVVTASFFGFHRDRVRRALRPPLPNAVALTLDNHIALR